MLNLKKAFSLALVLVMCLGLTVPAFAEESDWKMEVPGKSNAEAFTSGKTFILRDCGFYDYDTTGELILYKEDDFHWTAENMCVLAKGDTAVFTYHNPEESTNPLFFGSTQGGTFFYLVAWSDPDGDCVYEKRRIN